MKCSDIRNLIPDYVGEKKPDYDKTLVDNHFLSCPSCCAERDEMRLLISFLSQNATWKPSDTYWTTLLPRIHERIEKKRVWLFSQWVPQFAMPAISIVAMGIILMNIVPFDKNVPAQNSSISLQQVIAGDLVEYLEQQSVVGDQSTLSDRNTAADDVVLIENLLREEPLVYNDADVDQESVYDAVSERDANNLLPILEKVYSVSRDL